MKIIKRYPLEFLILHVNVQTRAVLISDQPASHVSAILAIQESAIGVRVSIYNWKHVRFALDQNISYPALGF